MLSDLCTSVIDHWKWKESIFQSLDESLTIQLNYLCDGECDIERHILMAYYVQKK